MYRFIGSARACLAADETFYVPEGRCIKYGPYADYDPCVDKIDQILYDGKNNEGICDCVLDERQLVSYQGECYELYTQVNYTSILSSPEDITVILKSLVLGRLPK